MPCIAQALGALRVSSEEQLLTGHQAAEFLGVKAATLYAYASRGMIESIKGVNGRERCYRLTDLIKLRQSARGYKTTKETETPTWTGPAIKSAITEIRPDGHYYRGRSAAELALANEPFESVAELLWGEETAQPESWRTLKPLSAPFKTRSAYSEGTDYLDWLKLLLVLQEMADPVSRKLAADNIFEHARRLIITMAIKPGCTSLKDAYICESALPIAKTLLFTLTGGKSKEQAKVINRALVLCADHELNASTLAARIAASCDASLYSCLLSALGTFSGTLHGSASRRAEDMVSTSLRFKTARLWLKDYLKQFDTMPGFGMELYEQGDPRAKLLIETAAAIGGKSVQLRRLLEIVECVREEMGLEPHLDFGLAAISYALSLPPGSGSTIFAVSRASGWIAHAIEQRHYGGIIRPRARYIGRV